KRNNKNPCTEQHSYYFNNMENAGFTSTQSKQERFHQHPQKIRISLHGSTTIRIKNQPIPIRQVADIPERYKYIIDKKTVKGQRQADKYSNTKRNNRSCINA